MLSSGVSRFHFDFFGLTVLKNFVRNPFKLPEIFGYRNFLCMRRKSRSSFEIFGLTVRKKFLGTTSKIQNVWDLGNFFAYHGFPSIFLSHSSEKLREERSFVSDTFKCQVSKKLMQKNGISRHSVAIFLTQSAEKFRWGTLRYIRKVRLSKNFMPNWVISLFSVEFLSRLLPIKLAGEPLCDPGFFGDIENFYAK